MRGLWGFVGLVACHYQTPPEVTPGEPDAAADTAHVDPDQTLPDASIAARRKSITILGSQISDTLADFPVWISLPDADLAARAQPDGTDIFFTDADGAALDHEIERFDPGAPLLLAWVRIPMLVAGVDTVIHVEYGDLARAVAPDPAGVFGNGFAAVWHLEDTLAAATIADSTGTHAGTTTLLGPAASTSAQLGRGVAFDGNTASSIAFTNMLTGSMPHTFSAWVTQDAVTRGSSVISVGTASTDDARFLYGHRSGISGPGPLGLGFGGDDMFPSGTDIEGDGWTMLAWTFGGADRVNHVFVNGVEVTPPAGTLNTNTVTTTGTTGLVGLGLSGFSFAPMKGVLDEVRIATVVRTPGWVATEYRNQSSTSTFYTVGDETIP